MSNQLVANESGEKTVLMLFHNDLRVHDNATLSHAAALADSGSLIMVYASELTDSQTPNWGQAYHFD